jgi:uncharacterized membrane protein YvbJ
MPCAQCGHNNKDGAKFCNECGSPLPLICAACGTENPPGSKFCNECGSSIPKGETTKKGRGEAEENQSRHQTSDVGHRTSDTRLQTLDPKPVAYTPSHLAERIRAEQIST